MAAVAVAMAGQVVADLREKCATPAPLLRDLASAMADEMGAGLEKEGGSRVKMLLSYVDKLPTGREEGLFYGLDLGGTNFRVLKVQLGGNEKHVVNRESREVTIPPHLMSGSSSDLFSFIASELGKFVADEEKGTNLSNGKIRELGFTFSFPVRQRSVASGTLVKWTKAFSIDDAVGEDVVAALQTAMEKQGLDMHVAALVRIARIFNTYGPRMCLDDGRVISNFVAQHLISTSRNATVRKEAENDVISAKQESIPKVNTGSSRVSQLTSLPQTKDSSLSNSKVSADTDFGIFDLAKFSKKNALPCDVCMRYETVLNRIFVCSSCKAAVHLDCYKSLTNSTGPWKCEFCQEMPSEDVISGSQSDCNGAKSRLVQCSLCHGTSGAFRKTTKGQWVHAFCAEWLLEGMFRRGQYNAVDGLESLLKDKDTCSICHHNVGTCLKCSTVDCQLTFHPACARDAGLYMNTKNFVSMLRHKAYCGKHSIEQRKADCQQYGSEEVKSMKQMRVELEILRLLCERIVKREKAKKDLAVCGHDILAARRDSTAFSMRTSYYASAPGASLESATTSVNNNSYSGTMQRSDDVTVDSTISRKHTVRLHNMDADRNTADSSTSTISYKRKLDDEESPADKNLLERPATASQKSEGEMKSTDQKNQCPRKRYVYTRRSSMSKKQQWSRDVEGPGG